MKIGTYAANTTTELKVLCKAQILQLKASGLSSSTIDDFMDSKIRVWNDFNSLIPPMKLRDLVVLNGDEYPVQVSLQSASGGGTFTVVMDIEISDEGYLNPVIYTEFINGLSAIAVDLSAETPVNSTAVKVRNYNTMAIMAPKLLKRNSICIIPLQYLSQLQCDNDIMSDSEILTHSNRVLADGCMREVHPMLWDYAKSTPAAIDNCVYTEIMKNFAMGYGSLSTGYVVISTGNHDFTLYPNGTANIVYCEKSYTIIAQQVQSALSVSGMSGNVDEGEFAAAVAAVGAEAARQKIGVDKTQIIANKVVDCLPSVLVSKAFGIKNYNISSEKSSPTGNNKIVASSRMIK